MSLLVLSFAQQDAACADQLSKQLAGQGYTLWQEPSASFVLSASQTERAVLRSAAVILMWSQSASQSSVVAQHLQIAQQLLKPLLPVALDHKPLPATLVPAASLPSPLACDQSLAALQPHLPSPTAVDELSVIYEKAAHDYIRERRAAVAQAAALLQHQQYRPQLLALLRYMVVNDSINSVRDDAQQALDADQQPSPVRSPVSVGGNRERFFGVTCENCGHVSYYDKQVVCGVTSLVVRSVHDKKNNPLDELDLRCKQCGEINTVRVDCEGYR